MNVRKGPHKYQFIQFERNFLKVHFDSLTNRQLAEMLGHTLTLVRNECYSMGLKRMELEYWTEEQVTFLKEKYREYGDSELAEIFDIKWHKDKGWTKKHIEKKRRYLILKRTDAEKKSIFERNKNMGRWAICPVKMWEARGVAEVGERRIWTNTDGRNYMVIKIKTGFIHYAPWLYEQIYGLIPEGQMVRTIDGDPLNVKPGNLMLVTRAEHAILNSQNRLPKELREIKKLSSILKKEIYATANRKETAEHA